MALLALPLAAAEPRPKSADRPARPNPAGPRGPGMRLARILTEEQQRQVRQTMVEHRAELRDLDERIQHLQRDVEQEVFAQKPNDEAIRSKAQSLAEAEAQRTVFRARVIARIRPSLTDDQIAQLKQVWATGPRANRPGRRSDQPGPGAQREGDDLPPPNPASPRQNL